MKSVRIKLSTTRNGLFEITSDVKKMVEESGVSDGIAVVYIPHTTAGVTVISRMDLFGFEDIENEMERLIPTRINFKHQFDTPTDASGHIKCSLQGVSATFIIEDRKLMIGSSQGIFFFEFDGPRNREFIIKIIEG